MKTFFQFLLVALLSLTSCKRSDQIAQVEQRLNLNIPSDPATLDPRKGADLTSSIFNFLLFDGLTRLNEEGNITMALAEKIHLSEDQKTYTFYLKEAYWSDGSLITSHDFAYSWKAILSPNFPAANAHLLYPILNAEKIKRGECDFSELGLDCPDSKTFVVRLETPTPYFLELVSFCVFYPVCAKLDLENPNWERSDPKDLIVSGPFSLKKWKSNNTIVLKRNPTFHGKDQIELEEMHFYMVDNEMTALQMFEKGQIDILGQPLMPLPNEALGQLIEDNLLSVRPVPATTFCTFNVEIPPFDNQNIRKAFSYAIDRKELTSNITQLDELAALRAIPPILKPLGSQEPLLFDGNRQEALKHLLKGCEELGIDPSHFPSIDYLYSTSDTQKRIAQALQQQWLDVLGIKINLINLDKKILMHHLTSGHYQAAQSIWMAQYQDAMNIFERFKHRSNAKNYPNWENQDYIDLLNQSALAKTKEERFALLDQAEEIFIDQMPIAPIFHWNSAYITQPWVKRYGTAPIGDGFFDRVYIDVEVKKGWKRAKK